MKPGTMNENRTKHFSAGKIAGLAIVLLLAGGLAYGYFQAQATEIVVYKSPYCGCCVKWVEHLEANGFTVKSVSVDNMNAIKKDAGLPSGLASCHTAIVDDRYVVEGHVPAEDIAELLQDRPDIKGLAVPGMPAGSPGMESPDPVRYEVLAFDEDGAVRVYDRHQGHEDPSDQPGR